MRRAAALLALLVFAPVALAEPPEQHRVGDGIKIGKAPYELPDYPEVVEVGYGLVWLELENGYRARSATKVGPGVYLTAEAWDNASKAFDDRGKRIQELEAEVAGLTGRPALECPDPPAVPERSMVSTDPAVAQQSSGLGIRGALVVLGAGILVGAVGGAYLTAQALR